MKPGPAATLLFAAALVPILASCASMPEQKYLRQASLANTRKVVVVASSKNVRVVGNTPGGFILAGLVFGPAGLVAGAAMDSVLWGASRAVDAHRSADVRAVTRKETIAQRLSGHFTRSLSSSRVFESIQEAPEDRVQSPNALTNFDAVIRLNVTELSLRPVTQNEMSLFVEISAEMVSLREGKEDATLWNRTERLASNEPHSMEFYRSNGIPVLDECLGKLGRRLAADIAYSE